MLLAVMRAALTACIALLGLAGCSLGADEEPETVEGAPREIAAVVDALEQATRRGDYRTICDDLFTSGARRRAGGADCARLLRSTSRGLRRPRIELLEIKLKERGAEVRVRTRAEGQPSLVDTIEMSRERGEYRIEALAG
jgi:hypothetical protein